MRLCFIAAGIYDGAVNKGRTMLKATLIGYGRMGQAIHQLANDEEIEIISRIDPHHPKAEWRELVPQAVEGADICIDFTTPGEVLGNIERLGDYGKSIVVGTTGWYDHLERARQIAERKQIGLFYSENFSIGMNLFKKIVAHAASLINDWPSYDVALIEQHHRRKLDSPSGSAMAVARLLLKNIRRKKWIVTESLQREPKENEIHVQSVRCGSIPGTHQVLFDSAADQITITHEARNRNDFALGALLAAKWLHGRKGLYNMDDLMASIEGGNES